MIRISYSQNCNKHFYLTVKTCTVKYKGGTHIIQLNTNLTSGRLKSEFLQMEKTCKLSRLLDPWGFSWTLTFPASIIPAQIKPTILISCLISFESTLSYEWFFWFEFVNHCMFLLFFTCKSPLWFLPTFYLCCHRQWNMSSTVCGAVIDFQK